MKVVLVRHIEDKGILGVFWGANNAVIWDCVDELCDPSDYEFASLADGAIYSGKQGSDTAALQWEELPEPQEETFEDFDWTGYEASEGFTEQLHHQKGLRWKRFDFSDEGNGLIARIVRQRDAKQAAN